MIRFPLVIPVTAPIPEIGAEPGDRLHIDPLANPSILLVRAIRKEPGELYGWLLGQMLDETVTVSGSAVSRERLIHALEEAVGDAPRMSPAPAPAPVPRPRLLLLE